jgi:N-acetylneuraminic acid mutarotase
MPHWNHLAAWLLGRGFRSPRGTRARRRPCRPQVERLEDRTVPSPLQAGPLAIHATEGLLYDGAVTTFTDANKSDTAANFTATIAWGDGGNSTGHVIGSGGQLTVSGQHTYTEEGNFPMSVLVQQDNGASLTIGGPPAWTPLAATLPPALTDFGAPVRGRDDLAATAGTDGKIYAIGGRYQTTSGFGGPTDAMEAYDPGSQTWAQLPSLPGGPRWSLSATTGLDGKIYTMGGLIPPSGNASSEFDVYDPATQTWTRLPDLPNIAGFASPRQFYAEAATGTDGTIYAVGGFFTNEVDAYNPASPTPAWTQVASLPSSRYFAALTVGTDGTIYSMGGVDSNTHAVSNEVDAYDPTTNTWTVLPSMPDARYALAAATGKDGTIYALGGGLASGFATTEVDAYNPVTKTWTVLGQSLPLARESLAAVTGADGTIYALGGDTALPVGLTNEVDTYLPPGKGANTGTVTDAPLTASGATFSTTGVTFAGQTVATFTDPGGAEPLADYSAVIAWGDNSTPDAGSVHYDSGTGQFSVQGSHTYPQISVYTVSVSIGHDDAAPAVVTTTAHIGSLKPAAAITGPTAGLTGQSLTFTVSANDPIASLNAAGFAYSIDWDDGSQASTVPAASNNGSGVDVRHAFAAGSYTVQVTATDQSGNSATASIGVTVSPADTHTDLSPSPASPYWGQNVTFTASVSPVAPGAGTPTGTVTFYDGGAPLGPGTLQLVNGVDQASFSTAALAVGAHTITACYGSDPNFNGSTSDGVSVNVSQATPVVNWSNPADIVYGRPLGRDQLDAGASVPGTFAYTPGTGAVLHAGRGQVLGVVFTPADAAHYGSVSQSVFINVTPAQLTVTADDKSKVYGAGVPPLTARYDGFVNGDTSISLGGSPDLGTDATQYSAPGPYTITVGAGTLADPDYTFQTMNGTLTVSRAVTVTSLTASTSSPLAGVDAVDLTANVTINAPGGGTVGGSVDFVDTTTGHDFGSVNVVNGVATLHAGTFAAGAHAFTAAYSGDTNFQCSSGAASLTAVAPGSLSGTVFEDFNDDGQVDFGEQGIGGVSITLAGTDDLGHCVNLAQTTDGDGAYVFLNLRPGAYYLTEASQPSGYTQGIDSVGSAGGQLAAADQFFVQLSQGVNGLNYNYGERPAAAGPIQAGQTAGIGFWNNKNGQALILDFNGGTGHRLGDWLSATFVNLYGANSANNLAGKSNAYVAALFQQDFLLKGLKLDAQVLATALSVYATSAALDDTQVAAQYGFKVQGDGVGTATLNVSANGDAFRAADGSTMTVLDLLLAADAQAVNGLLYDGSTAMRKEANNVFSAINQSGAIG